MRQYVSIRDGKPFRGKVPTVVELPVHKEKPIPHSVIDRVKRGDKRWGEPCSKTSECEEGICFPDDRGTSRCSPLCSSDRKCPIGYRCVTKVNPKRKSIGMVSVCIEKL